MMLIIDINIG